MMQRILIWWVRRYVGGPAQSWVFASGALSMYRLVRASVGKRELIDVTNIKPGEKIIIESLDVSHQKQIKDIKREKRSAKRAAKKSS